MLCNMDLALICALSLLILFLLHWISAWDYQVVVVAEARSVPILFFRFQSQGFRHPLNCDSSSLGICLLIYVMFSTNALIIWIMKQVKMKILWSFSMYALFLKRISNLIVLMDNIGSFCPFHLYIRLKNFIFCYRFPHTSPVEKVSIPHVPFVDQHLTSLLLLYTWENMFPEFFFSLS